MFARWFVSVALLGLMILPSPVRAAAEETTPTLVIRLRSIDALFSDFQYVASLAGREEEGKQLQGLLSSRAGPKGLEGIDTKRPLGLYGSLDANLLDSTAVALIPITDEKAFLDLLEGFNFKAKKESDGIYTIIPENFPFAIYLRFANKYVYAAAREKTPLDPNKLPDPAKLLALKPHETLGISFRVDQIPDVLKQLLTSQVEVKLADLEDQKVPDETEAQRKVRIQGLKESSRQIIALINELREVALGLGINRDAKELFAEFTIAAKPNTELANTFTASAGTQSLFAGLQSPTSAAEAFVHGSLPEGSRQLVVKSVDELIHGALEKEKDAGKRAVAEMLYNAVLPTIKAGELDAAVSLRGPTKDKHYAVVVALKMKEPQSLENVLRDLRQQIPPADRNKIKVDAETAGAVKIHRLDVQEQFDENGKKVLGANPFYLAFRSDALFVAGGEGGLSLLKEGLAGKPGSLPPSKIEVSMSRLAPLMALDQKADVPAIAQKAFGGIGQGNDKIQLTKEGGQTVKVRFAMKADVIKFFSLLDKANKGE
jgi:hypothetical protein